MASSAQPKVVEKHLQPTPVEQGLVTAMIEEKDNWPVIYQEMSRVSKDDLLADSEFCERYKHPSLTAFFVECGEIGGVKISLLRKYQRAGSYYESARTRYPELPPLTDEKVRNTPPDLFALVAKINHQIRKSGSASVETRGQIEYYYLSSLIEGTIARKDLKKVYSLLSDEEGKESAEQAIYNLIETAPLRNPVTKPIQMNESGLESKFFEIFSGSNWLTYIKSLKVNEGAVSVSLSGASLYLGGCQKNLNGGLVPDIAVVENATGTPRAHAFEIKSNQGLENARTIHRLNRWIKASSDGNNGYDFIWVATDECDFGKNDLEELGLDENIGVLCLSGEALRVIREPKQLTVDCQAQLLIYKAATLLLASCR